MTQEIGFQGSTGERLRLDDTSQAILSAALDEIREGGYRDESFARIAAAAGLTREQLHDLYPDERELLVDTLRLRDDRALDFVPEGPGDGRAMLQGFIDIARYNQETPGSVELFTIMAASATSPDHPGHAYFRARYAWSRQLLIDALRELEEEGELRRRANPEEVAAQAIALLDGLQVQWLLDREVVDLEGMVRRFLNQFLYTPLEPGRPVVLPRA
ncbi:TetR/AcrR family transcriptional regulator [Demequina pelophila]|uniref:TetR/AcrR family transcriptional regulator n=1 Tax=Demequina pelophila TaxID=1638984 RepID=UPI000780D8A5|nr:TetR/AcrR family transcriptional regulator [Demequina pelophila]